MAVGHIFVAGVGGFAVGIARHGIGYARDALEIGFQAPEAAACQINGFDVHRFSFLRGIGFVEFFGIGGEFGLRVGQQGEGLGFVQAAFDDALHIAVFAEQHPRWIHAHAQLLRDGAARIGAHGEFFVFQAAIPLGEIGGGFFVQIVGRGDGDKVGGGKAFILRPCFGLRQFAEAERTPACPEFDQRGAFGQRRGGFALAVGQFADALGQTFGVGGGGMWHQHGLPHPKHGGCAGGEQ